VYEDVFDVNFLSLFRSYQPCHDQVMIRRAHEFGDDVGEMKGNGEEKIGSKINGTVSTNLHVHTLCTSYWGGMYKIKG